MRTLRALVLGIVAGALLAPAAIAADLGGGPARRGSIKDAPLPPSVPLYSWSGLYIGAHVGYGWSDLDWTAGGATSSDNGGGWLGGAQIGYNWQRGALVFGVEADITGSGIDGTTACPAAVADCTPRGQLAGLGPRPARRHRQRQPHAVLCHGGRRLGGHRLHLQPRAASPTGNSAGWLAAASSTC